MCVYLQCKEWLLVLNHMQKNVVFVNYIIDTKVGTVVYIIVTTVYFWDWMYAFILKNIYSTTIQYYRLVNL